MTEVEMYEITASYLEVVAAFMGNYASHVSIYLSLVFGYCVVAYAAGGKLTRFQVIVASIMFVAAAEMQTLSMTTWVNSTRDILVELARVNPGIGGRGNITMIQQIAGILIWQLGIVAALIFMISVRRSNAQH